MAKISADEYFLCLGYFYFSGLGFPKEFSNSLVSLSWAYIINTHGVKMANNKTSFWVGYKRSSLSTTFRFFRSTLKRPWPAFTAKIFSNHWLIKADMRFITLNLMIDFLTKCLGKICIAYALPTNLWLSSVKLCAGSDPNVANKSECLHPSIGP